MAQAQGDFRTQVLVGDRAITGYEVQQRMALLETLGTGGDLRAIAVERLIEERLQQTAVDRAGITASGVEIERDIENFAARGNLTAAELIDRMAANGVAPDSFRQFIETGLVWRTLIRQRFSAQAAAGASEIDTELGLTGRRGGLEFQISEIFLPDNTEEFRAITEQLTPQILALDSTAAFEDAARRFSAGPSRDNGGRVQGWVSIDNLPGDLRDALPNARIGQVVGPIRFGGAIGLFQLRAMRETAQSSRGTERLDYATYLVVRGGRAGARQVLDRVDVCNDFYGVARGQPREWLTRQSLPKAQIPTAVGRVLDGLDANEAAVLPAAADGSVTIVMLCARLPEPGEAGADDPAALRAGVGRDLLNRRLAAFADGYLRQLRDRTRITYK